MTPTIFENEFIRQGILLGNEFRECLPSPRSSEGTVMQVGDILNEISEATGWKQAKLAATLKVSQGTISKWRSAAQSPNKSQWDRVLSLIRRDARLAHLRHEASPGGRVPVMGRVGAGSIVEPDFDQAAPDGLYDVTLPFPIPDEMIGLVVEGDSMLPKYDPGDVIVVWREQRRSTISYLGQLVAVRTADGRRYLKKVFTGSAEGLYRLESFNAAPIADVAISWVGEIHAIVPAIQVFKVAQEPRQQRRKPAAQGRSR
jgi:repressor LexA